MAEYDVRPNFAVQLGAINMKLQQRGLRAAEINAGMKSLQEKGWLKPSSHAAIIVTEAAFNANPDVLPTPSVEDVERALLDAISRYGLRPGETVPLGAVHALQPRFTGDEIKAAVSSMQQKGWIVDDKLTETGYAAM
jgi:hypothetical protein